MSFPRNDTELFIEGLETGQPGLISAVPKADLHVHAQLGGRRGYVNARAHRDIPAPETKWTSMDDMHRWVDAHVGPLMKDNAGRKILIEAAFDRAREDGVSVFELGEDVWALGHHFQGRMSDLVEFYGAARDRFAPELRFLFQIGLSRHCSIPDLERWLAPFLERDGFFSVDLYGDELAQPIRSFKPLYRAAKERGLKLKAHVGEWGPADSVKEAVEELELDEVQHGISAASSPEVMSWLSAHRIQLNVCPSSNLFLSRVDDEKCHPLRVLFDNGVPVTVNTDDTLVFGHTLCDEYLRLFRCGLFTAKELDTMRIRGLQSREDRCAAREIARLA